MAFPKAYVEVLSRIHSDHFPLLVNCGIEERGASNQPFRITARSDHPGNLKLVEEAWHGEEPVHSKLDKVRI